MTGGGREAYSAQGVSCGCMGLAPGWAACRLGVCSCTIPEDVTGDSQVTTE